MNPQTLTSDDAKFNAILQAHNYIPPVAKGGAQDWYSQIKQNAPAPQSNISAVTGVGFDKIFSGAKTVGNALTSNEQNFGKDIAGAIIPHTSAQTNLNQARATEQNSTQNLTKLIQNLRSQGKDTSHAVKALTQIMAGGSSVPSDSEINPILNKSNTQILADAAGTALDVAAFGSYGNAAKGAESGKLLVKGEGALESLATKVGVPTSKKVATPVAEQIAKTTLSQTLKGIGKKTAVRTGVGAGLGYGYDVTNNLQQGKTGGEALKPGAGTLIGGTVPLAIGGIEATKAITKSVAPRIINSLVKPKTADFSYGKDPGRTVSELGITGNNLDDFANNIKTAKEDVGSKIGSVYENPMNADIKINAKNEIAKIDKAISEAAQGGKNNQNIVTQLNNIKDSLLYEHGIDANGNIIKGNADLSKVLSQFETGGDTRNYIDTFDKYIASGDASAESIYKDVNTKIYQPDIAKQLLGDAQQAMKDRGVSSEIADSIASKVDINHMTPDDLLQAGKGVIQEAIDNPIPKDLSNLSPKEAFALKQKIADATQFTGRPSDDKTVNSVLKDMYGGVKSKLNDSVGENNPEITKLNQQYADLTSAEIATRNRDKIVQRSNLISMPIKFGTAAGVVTAIASGGTAIVPAILAGITAGALDKALESTAVKSRVASWLGSQSPSVIAKILEQNPGIKTVLYRAIPKLASQLNAEEPQPPQQ